MNYELNVSLTLVQHYNYAWHMQTYIGMMIVFIVPYSAQFCPGWVTRWHLTLWKVNTFCIVDCVVIGFGGVEGGVRMRKLFKRRLGGLGFFFQLISGSLPDWDWSWYRRKGANCWECNFIASANFVWSDLDVVPCMHSFHFVFSSTS